MEFYPFEGKQSVYFTGPADWAYVYMYMHVTQTHIKKK